VTSALVARTTAWSSFGCKFMGGFSVADRSACVLETRRVSSGQTPLALYVRGASAPFSTGRQHGGQQLGHDGSCVEK
jgi:hypothetical protein